MKRRTVVLRLEIEGPKPDALKLRDELIGELFWNGKVVHAEVLDDGTGPVEGRPQFVSPTGPPTRSK